MNESLSGKTILITGAAKRVGKIFALACAREGADIVIHHAHSDGDAESLRAEILEFGQKAWVFKADLNDPSQAASLIASVNKPTLLDGLINSAAIFKGLSLEDTSFEDWQIHLQINLTAPFLLSQAFVRQATRIVNIFDWRALRPGADHLPFTISKAALAALIKSLAAALSPRITVNGLALGAFLPLSDRNLNPEIIKNVPVKR